MKSHYSAAELAALKLPELPGTEQGVSARAVRENWSFLEVAGKGGKTGKRREYALACLPDAARLALAEASSAEHAARLPAPAVSEEPKALAVMATAPAALRDSQLDCELARDRIFKFIADFGGSEPRAIDHLNAAYHAGTLPPPLRWAMDHAWAKRRADTRLNLDTLNKWKAVKKQRGRSAPNLPQKDMTIKPWHKTAVELKQRPQGSCMKWIAEEVAKAWVPAWGPEVASYHAIRRFFNEKFSQIDQLTGRHTGSALSPHKRFKKRSGEGLMPWDEIHADGWNTHFTAPHPVTGDYVTYEVWHAHCVAIKYVPPLAVGLTENFEVILKCIENVVRTGGCPLIIQTDSTKIVKNSAKMKTDPAVAISERVGFTFKHPVKVGNSQANGIAENWNVWLGREAKELATYQAKDMDSLTLKRVKKLTAKAVKAQKANDTAGYDAAIAEAGRMGKGIVLQSYEQALAWLEQKRQKWNAKPHRSLPKIRDPQTGKLRHMSPNEALQQARDNGWEPELFSDEYIVALFRPHTRVTVRRETVSPYAGMRYYHTDLGDWNGKEVVVAYDIMDWRQVWVKTLAGETICIAEFEQATGYRARSAYDAANEKRALAQIKHRERQIQAIKEKAGLDDGALEGEATRIDELTATEPQIIAISPRLTDAELAAIEAKPERQKPMDMMDLAMWLYADQIDEKNNEGNGDIAEKESAAV